jgi:hypothetical protein
MFKVTFASALLVIASGMSAQTRSTDAGNAELARIQSEYSDVLALQGTARAEVLAIARLLGAKPEMAIDHTKAAGEYCFKSSLGTMVHYTSQPEATAEDVVYEFDATQLLAAGLDPPAGAKASSPGQHGTRQMVLPPGWGHRPSPSACTAYANDRYCRQREVARGLTLRLTPM